MARKRSKKGRTKGAHCKVVRVNGKSRKLCWGKNGKLKSNKKA